MIKRVNAADLCLGMHVVKLSGAWISSPFWRKAFTIKREADIEKLRASDVSEIWIDTDKGNDLQQKQNAPKIAEEVDCGVNSISNAARPEKRPATTPTSFEAEFKQAKSVCNKATAQVASMFREVRLGKAVSEDASLEMVDDIRNSLQRNQQALISIARLKTHDAYTFMHSVAVCALMVALARELKQSDDEMRDAGVAGMLHDLGKALMPLDILNKPGKLSDEEFVTIKSHPLAGYELLKKSGGHRATTLDVVLHHHERMDGSGYPDKLCHSNLSQMAKIGAVCDVYDAITSNRPYKSGWDPATSIKRMASWQGHFDPAIFQSFVKSVGIYPMGSLVRLESGKVGVVIDQPEKALLKPTVKVFFSAKSKVQIKQEVIVLNAANCQDHIVSAEDNSIWKFKNLEELWLPSV